jgi:hypothetical protein
MRKRQELSNYLRRSQFYAFRADVLHVSQILKS